MIKKLEATNDTPKKLKKPSWIKVKTATSSSCNETMKKVMDSQLETVCYHAACPNKAECWSKGHVTVMILGDVCTRACAFCNVKTGIPNKLDLNEPIRIAKLCQDIGLTHIVITSVDRDDLADGGADQFAKVIQELRAKCPNTTIEILTPDFRNKPEDITIQNILKFPPDVFNHNLETVPRLYRAIRPGARYFNSLNLLYKVKLYSPSIFTKSGIMLGLGETTEEVLQVMDDMRSANVDFFTAGQYLQPTPRHAELKEYVEPEKFDFYARMAKLKGFLMVSCSPLTRSSYHAAEDFKEMQANRKAITSEQ